MLSIFLLFFSVWANISDSLNEAKRLMGLGKIQDALIHYDKAVELDNTNHLTYFRRATAYLMVGKNEMAIKDFDKVLELKGDNNPARLKRATLLLYQGEFSKALSDLELYLSVHGSDEKALEMHQNAQLAQENLMVLKENPSACDSEPLNQILSIAPKFTDILLRRAQCHLLQNDIEMAVGDLSRVLKLHPNRFDVSLQLSKLYASIGELDRSIIAIKECLRQDPDQKECKAQFRSVKRFQKGFASLEELEKKAKSKSIMEKLIAEEFLKEVEELGASPLKRKVYGFACTANHRMRKFKDAADYCTKTLEIESADLEARINRGETYLELEKFDEALNDFKTAHETDRQNPRITDGYRKAETLKKRASMMDYYKILGISRTASQREIKKAYRKKAQEWHPDKYKGDLTAEEVQKKMAEINRSYEILGNEETREQYDNGHDPNVSSLYDEV
ncbi:hypothetical protein BC833DRAFT_526239 [Globomyces pollinis-pini]|nr:hypothetical protein BC833DRAFT_526239 [Globomyces pollinis-pini]